MCAKLDKAWNVIMSNREVFFSWQELRDCCGGTWLTEPTSDGGIYGVCDDSRTITPGALFVAIPGDLSDGHKYLATAVAKGAGALCVSREVTKEETGGCPCLLVPDSLKAMQELARAYRHRFPQLTVLGITGSCGKTSTKEMCYAVLSQRWPGAVLKTEGNTNNHFGVPRNLLRLTADCQAAVIEMGSNHPGEIASLVRLVEPGIALVCNIGAAHLEAFHDLRGVAREKSAILAGCAPDGVAIYPHEAAGKDILQAAAGSRRTLTFGLSPDADVSCAYLGPREGAFALRLTWRATGECRELLWNLGGAHQALNAAAAAAVGYACGLSPEEIVRGLQTVELPGARMKLQEAYGCHWANDAYNSNPSSCSASLDWFAEILPPQSRALVILGDMLELGEASESAHREILDHARQVLPGAEIVTVGPHFLGSSAERGIVNYPNVQIAKEEILPNLQPGEWILLKGSNSIGLAKFIARD